MKKKRNIFLIIFMCLFLSLALTMHADSGWDGSYDSGGSSSWGGSYDSGGSHDYGGGSSWSGSSSTNHNSGHSSGGGSGSAFEVFLSIFFLMTILLLIFKPTKIPMKKEKIKTLDDIFYEIGYSENNIKKVLPDFELDKFRMETYEIYKSIQIAWMNFDYKTLEKLTTNELYNLYKSQLIALKTKKQQNVMKDFELLDFSLFNMEKGQNDISIKVRMKISCKDYVIDKNKKVVRGDKSNVVYDYEMTFTKGLDVKNNRCPNCNAPLENDVTSTCPYCDSLVISNNHNWVLSKKRVMNQYRRR